MYHPLVAILAMFLAAPGTDSAVKGDYVEARTAEVFTGGCIMGSEGEVSGREALMAWRVRQGSLDGVALDGLSVVAVVNADVNLGMHELGGASPSSIRTMLLVDARASETQQRALAKLARTMAPDLIRDVAATRVLPIAFERGGNSVRLDAGGASLDVQTGVEHTPTCSALKWFEPLARTNGAEVGLTRSFAWTGGGFGPRWSQFDRRSSFVGTFSLER